MENVDATFDHLEHALLDFLLGFQTSLRRGEAELQEHLKLLAVEKNRLDKVSQPLRQYLADNIIPILT